MTDETGSHSERVTAEALKVFGDKATAEDWLNTPNRALGGKPAALLGTDEGVDLVLRELGRIEHGVYP